MSYTRCPSLKQAAGTPDDPSAAKGLPEGLGVGDPDHLVRVIKRWESIGVDGINFVLNTSEQISQDAVLSSLRLFAAEVMPAFRSPGERESPVPASLPFDGSRRLRGDVIDHPIDAADLVDDPT